MGNRYVKGDEPTAQDIQDGKYLKADGTWDSPSSGGSVSADDVTYDNTTSGMLATNVQDALDEIAQDFQDGCDIISQAVIAKGQTPASNSPSDIAYAISNISSGGDSGKAQQEHCKEFISIQKL